MMGILELAIKYRENRFLRQPVKVSWILTLTFSMAAVFILNYATSGTGDHCTWSFFGIWAEEFSYLRESDSLWTSIGDLFRGTHSMWLWLYTVMHIIPALMLGWAAAAVVAVGRVIVKRGKD